MKTCRHCGQVISNDDGFNPVKILGDLHAKSVKKCKDQNIYPSNREEKGMLNTLHFHLGRLGVNKTQASIRCK